jgi:DNA-binding CsgD family transcriptional regulator
METWHLGPTPAPQALAADAVGLLLQAPQEGAPAATLLAFLNRLAPVDYLSLVEYLPQRCDPLAAPELVEGHARPGLANVTPDCFQHYRRWFWREDEGTRLAHQSQRRGNGVAALHVQAEEIHVASWRSEIYDRAHLSARLSFYYEPVPGTTFSINLYRDRSHGGFGRDEINQLLGVAPLLRQTHRMALCSTAAEDRNDRDRQVARAQAALRRKAPELSARELAVCARIACGISADGIAAELDVAPSTVVTLRKRAYAKLAARGVSGGRLQLAAFLH